MNDLIKVFDLKKINGTLLQDGFITVIENKEMIPFEIKRIYTIFCSDSKVVRGNHAHKNLKQIMICLSGSCKIVFDNGKKRNKIILNDPTQAILVEKPLWREISEFSQNCILMVLANNTYDESDYIRNYDEFLKIAEK